MVNLWRVSGANAGVIYCILLLQTCVISMDSVFLLIDIFILRIILLLMPKEGLIVKKIIKFFKLLKRRIDIYNSEAELKFILENK